MNEKKFTLKSARAFAEKSVSEVANYMGVSENTVYSWENGKNQIKAIDLKKLCGFYNILMDDIFLPTV